MNEYIFYTPEGYTYPPCEDMEVENCQVLGRALGNNPEEARNNLMQDNPWIKEYGFDIEVAICKQLFSDKMAGVLERKQDEIKYLVNLLDRKQLDNYNEWLHNK